VTSIFINSLWSRGTYFFQAIKSVGQPPDVLATAQHQDKELVHA
jgi:hypothetical protein